MSFGERLRNLRIEKGYTLQDMAKKFDRGKTAFSNYENDLRKPNMELIEKIADHFNVSIDYLIKGNKSNGLNISGVTEIPVLGSIAAGEPLLSEENITRYEKAPTEKIKNGQYFYLEVKGDSMINAGIKEGDLALIKLQEEVDHKDIAVVMVNNHEATLKRVFKNNGTVILQPENPNYDPIVIKNKEARIVGKLVRISREY